VTAVAGWLYAYQRSYISPDLISPFFLLFMLTAVILPGRRLLLGPLIGSAILTTQSELFSFGGNGDKIFLGGLLAIILLLSPDGLVGVWRWLTRAVRGRGAGAAGAPGGTTAPAAGSGRERPVAEVATAPGAAGTGAASHGATSHGEMAPNGRKLPRGPGVAGG
jgi:branched-chain amino acid transport system permease protein